MELDNLLRELHDAEVWCEDDYLDYSDDDIDLDKCLEDIYGEEY